MTSEAETPRTDELTARKLASILSLVLLGANLVFILMGLATLLPSVDHFRGTFVELNVELPAITQAALALSSWQYEALAIGLVIFLVAKEFVLRKTATIAINAISLMTVMLAGAFLAVSLFRPLLKLIAALNQ